MSDDILDEKINYARFKKPVTLKVNKTAWELICDDLQRKATIGTFIFLAIVIVVCIITMFLGGGYAGGQLLFLAGLGLAVFLNVGVRKRFKHLRTLADHSFVISGTQIMEESPDQKQTILFSKIKDIEFHNWGVELDTKKNRKMSEKNETEGRIKIPRAVNDYGRVVATFEQLKKS